MTLTRGVNRWSTSERECSSTLHALWLTGARHLMLRNGAEARECGGRLLTLGGARGLKQYRALGGILHRCALLQLGGQEEGLRDLNHSLRRLRRGPLK